MGMDEIICRKSRPAPHIRLALALILVLGSCLLPLFSEETNFPGVFRYKLENGLELFVAENSSAPLASIHIAARTGSISHTPENAGLIHLYEHMLFKGNSKYKNEVECTGAMNKMGAIDSNAYTSVDIVNYYFTVPSSEVKNGLEFWSLAVRTPKFDEIELKNEIAVVLSEINAGATEPHRIRYSGMIRQLYPSEPWKLEPGGNPEIVKNATPEQMRQIQADYYVPENSAIFVGGDVHHEEIYKIVKKVFGDWKKSKKGIPKVVPPSKNPLSETKKMVFVNPGSADSIMSVNYVLRGPDGETDSHETYAADVWAYMVQNPGGAFARTFVQNKKLCIPDSDYISGYYGTYRASGQIGFSAAMQNQGELNPVQKGDEFYATIQNQIVPLMTDKSRFFEEGTLSQALRMLENRRIYELETADSILSSLASSWSSCGSDYFFSYDEKLSKVTEEEVVQFVAKYIKDKAGVMVLTVSPGIWAKYEKEFEKAGYERIVKN